MGDIDQQNLHNWPYFGKYIAAFEELHAKRAKNFGQGGPNYQKKKNWMEGQRP